MIFWSKAEAQQHLRASAPGKRAHAGNGNVYRCPWGDHYHITSKGKPGR